MLFTNKPLNQLLLTLVSELTLQIVFVTGIDQIPLSALKKLSTSSGNRGVTVRITRLPDKPLFSFSRYLLAGSDKPNKSSLELPSE